MADVGEFGLIDRLNARLGSLAPRPPRGAGDDAAVLATGPTTFLTVDTQEEEVHFRRAWSMPRELGSRALEINLSDVAAMGGTPTAAVVSLALPPELPLAAALDLYDGLAASARRARVKIVGGNVARGRRVAVTITLLGRPAGRGPGRVLTRSGARPGDLLVVSGPLGLAGLGHLLLDQVGAGADLWTARPKRPAWRAALNAGGSAARAAIARFLAPIARLEVGRWAARHGASAAIDLSDGLAGDLRHLAESSKVGARLHLEALPLARGFVPLCGALGVWPYDLALSGGEDYELLMAFPPAAWARARRSAATLGAPLTLIGEVTARRQGVMLVDGERMLPLEPSGFRHF